MEENSKKKKIKDISIAVGVCVVVLACLAGISIGTYNMFSDNINKSTQTLAENTVEDENIEEEVIELIDPESLDELSEEQSEEQLEEKKEELTPEEKKKREEEAKKRQEELKKKQEEEAKLKAQGYPYWIKVNCAANTVTIYKKDENGKFTIPVKAMVCSVGSSTPRSGVYRTPQKARWGTLIGPVWGQYCTRITGQILFHSVPYLKQNDPSSLEYWEYDRLGTQRSLGCIRLTVADAQWIYYNCPLGTSVEFYTSSNPGPLGKPGVQKVSNAGDPYRGWDPTDPDSRNPWPQKKAKEEAERKAAEQKAAKEAAEKKAAEEKAAKEAAEKKAAEEKAAKEAAEKKAAEEKAAKEAAEKKKAEEEARKAEEANKVMVPDVRNMTKTQAQQALKDLNFKFREEEFYTGTDGVVIKQSIAPGTKVNKQTSIEITIRKVVKQEDDKENDKNTNDGNEE